MTTSMTKTNVLQIYSFGINLWGVHIEIEE